jgi:Domain of unknown function (DUF4412)
MKRPLALVTASLLAVALVGCHHDDKPAPAGSGSSNSPAPPPPPPPPAAAAPSDGLPFASGFEGELDLVAKTKSSPNPVPFSLLVKNDVVRFDLPTDLANNKDLAAFTGGGKVYAILKAADKKLTAVLDGKREAIAIDLNQAAEQAKAFHPPGGHGGSDTASSPPPKVTKSGKTETVAGYPCDDWTVTNADKSKVSLCVANTGASFFNLPLSNIPTENAWALELADGKHFPLRAISYEKDGAESGRMEVTKIDKHSLDASQFEVPAGYKTMSLQDMMSGMGGLGGMNPGDLPHPDGKGKGPHHHHGGGH